MTYRVETYITESKFERVFELTRLEFTNFELDASGVNVSNSFHIVVCFCLYHKYNTSAANTTIKCWKNSRETINFSIVSHLSG